MKAAVTFPRKKANQTSIAKTLIVKRSMPFPDGLIEGHGEAAAEAEAAGAADIVAEAVVVVAVAEIVVHVVVAEIAIAK